MEEVQNQKEPALTLKRKPDPCFLDQEISPNKAQKVQSFHSSPPEEANGTTQENLDSTAEVKTENLSLNSQENIAPEEAKRDENGGSKNHKAVEDDDEDEDEDRERDMVDRKGKGNLRDDKGKGKLIEEEDEADSDDDDDDSSDVDMDSDGDSDLSDDPLAEVDLDNILPSRTRRRVMQPGMFISNEIDADEDDDSDDSDA